MAAGTSIRVVVSGAAGKMGATVCAAVEGADDVELVARADPALDVDLATAIADAKPDVVVDFTTPDVVFNNAHLCLSSGVHAVVGTTGLTAEQLAELKQLASGGDANCFIAPNFALGAVLMMQAAKLAASHMDGVEIVELHHDRKLDAPSGTAKRTAELIGQAGGQADAPIHSVRLPGLVAHQEVIFGGQGETLTIRHDSISRESFMPGVLLAVRRVASLDGLVVGLENLLND
ncbi:MAG: 4-hydroxy-tetrahydrodipicolinate reductase [Solirubrobacterales bacterium]